MNLLVDIGNHRLKWARGDIPGEWRERGDFECGDRFNADMAAQWGGFDAPGRVVVSSVAHGAVDQHFTDWVNRQWSLKPEFIRAGRQAGGIHNRYRVPDMLGSDRWAAMIGARYLEPGSFCVVDCGTAVTVDAVADGGDVAGGAILPGLAMARAALVGGTSGIRIERDVVARLDGEETADCVAAGTLYGLVGGIDRLLAEYQELLGDDAVVFITGGDAPAVQPHLKHPTTRVDDLVLQGLARIAGQPA